MISVTDGFAYLVIVWNYFPCRETVRKMTVFFEQIAVEGMFHSQMIISGKPGLRNYITMAFAVQCKVADAAQEVGISTMEGFFFLQQRNCCFKKRCHALIVQELADSIYARTKQRMIKEKNIRSLEADSELFWILSDDYLNNFW